MPLGTFIITVVRTWMWSGGREKCHGTMITTWERIKILTGELPSNGLTNYLRQGRK